MTRKNKAGKRIIVERVNHEAWMNGERGIYEGHCFGCRRSSASLPEAEAHKWADGHSRSCSVG